MSYDVALGIDTPFLNQLLDQITKVIFHPQESNTAPAALVAGTDSDADDSTSEKIKKLLAEYMPPVVSLESPNLVAYFAEGGSPTLPDSETWPDTGIFCCINPALIQQVVNILGDFPIQKKVEKKVDLKIADVVATAQVTVNSIEKMHVEEDGKISATIDCNASASLEIKNIIHNITIPVGIQGNITVVFKPTIVDNKFYLDIDSVNLDPTVDLPGWLKAIEEKIMELVSEVLSEVIKLALSQFNPIVNFDTITIMDDMGINIDNLETAAKDSYLLANAQITVVEKSVAV